jgi:glycosyltransferase involved in cell wall biosynthesis
VRVAIDALALRRPFTGVQRSITSLLTAFDSLIKSGDQCISADDSFVVLAGRRAELPPLSDRFTVLRTIFKAENRTLRILYQQFLMHGRFFKAGAEVLHAPAYVSPRLTYIPTVLTIHDMFAFDFPALCKKVNVVHFKNFVPPSVKNARRIIVPSTYTRERLIAQFPEAGAKTAVIPFGVDDAFFADVVPEWPLDERPLPERFVLYVGGLELKKNLETLIKAFFATTLSKKLDIDLVIAGPDTGSAKHLQRIAEGLGFGNRIHFLGFVEDALLPALYRKAAVFAFPSIAEGFGFPVLEAMASGIPVIASGIPALREIGGKAVRFFTPGNIVSLREALEELLLDSKSAAYFAERGKEGKERARFFTWTKTAQGTMRVYREARL